MHGDDRRRLAVLREVLGEPVDLQRAVVAAADRGVARDDPHAADVDDVRVRAREQVVVAGEVVDGHRQRREQLAGELVLAQGRRSWRCRR